MQQQNNHPGRLMAAPTRSNEEMLRGFEWFAFMRANHPVSYNQQMNDWHIFRYEDVYRVITDHQTFSSQGVPNFSELVFLRETLVTQDPPDHRRLRTLATQAFTPRAMTRLTATITQITQDVLDKVLSQGKIEIVSDVAFPVTTNVLASMLDVPNNDWPLLCRWVKGMEDDGSSHTREEVLQANNRMGQEMYDYFSHHLATACHEPRGDLITALRAAEINGKGFSEDELVKFCLLLLVAGQETVQNLLTNAIYCVTTYPESYAHLIQHPEDIPTAIEEVLRYLPPFWITVRRTTTDTELGGQRIRANTIIQAWNASANRDPAHFSDPERFDIHRTPNHHLSLGHGIHFCLGAPLARLEARLVLSMLFKQLKHLQRPPNTPIDVGKGPLHRIHTLPVLFEP